MTDYIPGTNIEIIWDDKRRANDKDSFGDYTLLYLSTTRDGGRVIYSQNRERVRLLAKIGLVKIHEDAGTTSFTITAKGKEIFKAIQLIRDMNEGAKQ